MSKQRSDNSTPGASPHPETAHRTPAQDEPRVDVGTADDINVDEDNAVESPKNSLTAAEPPKRRR